jgi:uncharacterized protein with HEPN domain
MPSPTQSRDEASLVDILDAARLINEFVTGLDKASFLADVKTQSAVLHQLLLLGEATKRLSAPLRAAHPQVPWRGMAGMRDKLIHDYDDVDLDEVWKTIQTDVPHLVAIIEPLVMREAE